jgi:hypothetical protein
MQSKLTPHCSKFGGSGVEGPMVTRKLLVENFMIANKNL